MDKPDGYRYVRAYRVKRDTEWRWALWEVTNQRARRVGTAETEAESEAHLAGCVTAPTVAALAAERRHWKVKF